MSFKMRQFEISRCLCLKYSWYSVTFELLNKCSWAKSKFSSFKFSEINTYKTSPDDFLLTWNLKFPESAKVNSNWQFLRDSGLFSKLVNGTSYRDLSLSSIRILRIFSSKQVTFKIKLDTSFGNPDFLILSKVWISSFSVLVEFWWLYRA